MGERRKYERRRPGQYAAVFDRDSQQLLGRLANLSTEGFMLVRDQPLGANVNLRCKVMLPEDMNAGQSVAFEARTLWCRPGSQSGTYQVGLHFVSITLKDLEKLEQLTVHPAFEAE